MIRIPRTADWIVHPFTGVVYKPYAFANGEDWFADPTRQDIRNRAGLHDFSINKHAQGFTVSTFESTFRSSPEPTPEQLQEPPAFGGVPLIDVSESSIKAIADYGGLKTVVPLNGPNMHQTPVDVPLYPVEPLTRVGFVNETFSPLPPPMLERYEPPVNTVLPVNMEMALSESVSSMNDLALIGNQLLAMLDDMGFNSPEFSQTGNYPYKIQSYINQIKHGIASGDIVTVYEIARFVNGMPELLTSQSVRNKAAGILQNLDSMLAAEAATPVASEPFTMPAVVNPPDFGSILANPFQTFQEQVLPGDADIGSEYPLIPDDPGPLASNKVSGGAESNWMLLAACLAVGYFMLRK